MLAAHSRSQRGHVPPSLARIAASASGRRRLYAGTAALALALAFAMSAGAASAAAVKPATGPARSAGAGLGSLLRVQAAPGLLPGDRAIGAVSPNSQITAAVAMKLPDQQAVTRFIDLAADPQSRQFHQYLSKGQFARRFGPSRAAVRAVENQLTRDGLKIIGVSANRLLVSFSGSASRVEAAFHTGLQRVRLASGGIGRAATSAVQLPAAVAHDVQAVIGLNALVHEGNGLMRPLKSLPHGRVKGAKLSSARSDGGPVACPAATALEQFGALTDQQVAHIYGLDPLYSAGDLGQGQTVDIYELEAFNISDVATFDKCYFGASHTSQITVTTVDGGPGTGPGSGEAALDIDNVSAIAPDAKIDVFSGPNMDNSYGPLDTWNQMAIADNARQATSSWGLCETDLQLGAPGVLEAENEIFEQMAAQGQTVFNAAGDDGSDTCAEHASTPVPADLSVEDPASQPYVTSVGGTTVTRANEPPTEQVWNNGNSGGAGGGGLSEAWAQPPWQSGVVLPQTAATEPCSNDPSGTADNYHVQGVPTTLPSGTLCREAPDVSAVADPQTGITIVYAGQWFIIGGTSSSAPLWAAMLAEVNGTMACKSLPGGLGLGFATPLLYEAGASPGYADAFSDVTIGDNDNLEVGNGTNWTAGRGFDMASGLGTPRITDANGDPGLAAQLCADAAGVGTVARPQVSGLTQTSGNTGIPGGGTLQINGSNFGSTQGTVFFGDVTAQVTGWTPAMVTVTIPAYHAPAGSPAGVAGSANITVVTAGSPRQSSGLTEKSVYHYTANSSGGPVVDYVGPSTGPIGGGNTVDIVGAGLTGATKVEFGDVAATSFTVKSDNEISVPVPASDGTCAVSASQGICAVAVTVTTPHGTSSGPAILPAYQGQLVIAPNGDFIAPAGCGCEIFPQPEEYDYSAAPHITSVSPQYASENGTTTEVITGTHFNLLTFDWVNVGPAGVNFSADFDIEGISATQIAIGIPAAAPSTQPVPTPISVNSGLQLSNVSSLSYAGTPVLTGLSAHVGDQADPGDLTITGQGLSDVSSVVFQIQLLPFVTSTSTTLTSQTDTSLTVVVPHGYAAPADVLLCSVTGCTAPDPSVDTYTLAYKGRAVLTSDSPMSGPAHGGTLVTVDGKLDSEITGAFFGTTPATLVTNPLFTPSAPFEVLAPPGKAGTTVDITITTLGGTLTKPPEPRSAVNPHVTFTYTKSSPSAPLDVTARASGSSSAAVRWKAPSDNGGSAVTGYVITAYTVGSTGKLTKQFTTAASDHATSITLRHLKKGTWEFQVQAKNKLGDGLPGVSGSVHIRS
jgi:hypothetical protein